MTPYVALWRGINVGKAKRIPMADLRGILEGLGFGGVATLLNSGNAVFMTGKAGEEGLARRIRAAVLAGTGVDAQVTVKTGGAFADLCAAHPFGATATDPSRLLVAFTQEPSTLSEFSAWTATDWTPDALAVTPQAAYLWCAQGILASPLLKAVNRGLGNRVTTRNWATVEKLGQLVETMRV